MKDFSRVPLWRNLSTLGTLKYARSIPRGEGLARHSSAMQSHTPESTIIHSTKCTHCRGHIFCHRRATMALLFLMTIAARDGSVSSHLSVKLHAIRYDYARAMSHPRQTARATGALNDGLSPISHLPHRHSPEQQHRNRYRAPEALPTAPVTRAPRISMRTPSRLSYAQKTFASCTVNDVRTVL